ncbi:MAG: hypothetical protein IKC11_05785 [Clostridia bacterium]|nr:hypothetical protein [Clostridia bacterium]
MKKRLTRKRLVLLILLAIIYTLATALSFYIGVKLDPYGEKPYIVLPTVLTGIIFMILLAFTLLKIYPYANEYDKKKLEKKTLKNKTFQTNIDELKNLLSNNFELSNGVYTRINKRSGLFTQIKYTLFFEQQNNINNIIEKIKQNNKKGFDISTKYHGRREVDIYLIEVGNLPDEIKSLEKVLDEQYLDILKDPIKIIVPLIFEKNSQKLYYYEKWTKLNITLLAVATNYVKRLINVDNQK